jgi:hypothetical protein
LRPCATLSWAHPIGFLSRLGDYGVATIQQTQEELLDETSNA